MAEHDFNPGPTVTQKIPVDEESLVQILEREGATEVGYKGTWLEFEYAGLMGEVLAQGNRLVGKLHKRPATPEQRQCLEQASKIFKEGTPDTIKEFILTLDYRRFIAEGPANKAIHRVLELAKTPIEKVIAMYGQGYKDMGSYGTIFV